MDLLSFFLVFTAALVLYAAGSILRARRLPSSAQARRFAQIAPLYVLAGACAVAFAIWDRWWRAEEARRFHQPLSTVSLFDGWVVALALISFMASAIFFLVQLTRFMRHRRTTAHIAVDSDAFGA